MEEGLEVEGVAAGTDGSARDGAADGTELLLLLLLLVVLQLREVEP